MVESIFKRTSVSLMEKVLNISAVRQRVVASNIANVQTPGYVGKSVDFEESLARAVEHEGLTGRAENQRHIPIGNTRRHPNPCVVERRDQAGVDVEKEMALSAENQLVYATATRIVSGGFRALRGCIRGRF